MGCWVTPGRGKGSPLQGLSLLPELQSCRSPGLTASLPPRGQAPCPALLCCGSGRGWERICFSSQVVQLWANMWIFFLSLVESKSAFCAYWIVLNVAWLLYLVLVSGQKNVVTWYQWCLETSWSAFGKCQMCSLLPAEICSFPSETQMWSYQECSRPKWH